jgi:hypothetical protein
VPQTRQGRFTGTYRYSMCIACFNAQIRQHCAAAKRR